jgi:chemotaxis protein MotB
VGRKKREEEHSHSESWLVSYCDMISLLVTFFLMMMTFSTKDEHNVSELGVGILRGHGGIWSRREGVSGPEQFDESELTALAAELTLASSSRGDASALGFQPCFDGLTLKFNERSAFAPGSAVVPGELAQNLAGLAQALAGRRLLTVVEGFASAEEAPDEVARRALSLERARAASEVLLAASGVDPGMLQLAGHGSERPRAGDDDPFGRAQNRRVELRILAVSVSREASVVREARR